MGVVCGCRGDACHHRDHPQCSPQRLCRRAESGEQWAPGAGPDEVWVPPLHDVVGRFPFGGKCRHCGSTTYHARTHRCASCGRRTYRLDVLDEPTARAIQRNAVPPTVLADDMSPSFAHTGHKGACAAVRSAGERLCDCGAVRAWWENLRAIHGFGERPDAATRPCSCPPLRCASARPGPTGGIPRDQHCARMGAPEPGPSDERGGLRFVDLAPGSTQFVCSLCGSTSLRIIAVGGGTFDHIALWRVQCSTGHEIVATPAAEIHVRGEGLRP